MSKSRWLYSPKIARRIIGDAQFMGLRVRGIEYSDNVIRVLVEEQPAKGEQSTQDELDRELNEFAARHGKA